MKIIKLIEWDMGHRVTNHHSVCRNIHGHRYRAEVCIEGDLISKEGASNEGMIMDFADVKKIAKDSIHDVLDHGFMVWDQDDVLMRFFNLNLDLKHIVVPFVPTSKNIAKWIFVQFDKNLVRSYGTKMILDSIKLWETPTSAAVCRKKDI